MSVFSFSTATLNHSTLPSQSYASSLLYFAASLQYSTADPVSNPRRIKGRNCSCKTRIASSHSNPKILKSNRRSRYGQPLSPYDTDDDDDGGGSDEVDGDEDDRTSDVCFFIFCYIYFCVSTFWLNFAQEV